MLDFSTPTIVTIIIGFLGIGVTIIVARYYHNKHKQSDATIEKSEHATKILTTNNQSEGDRVSDLTPNKIRDMIEGVPALMEEDIINSVIGASVKWQAEVFSIHKEANNMIEIYAAIDEKIASHGSLVCVVSLDDYPELKYTKNGTLITVEGNIENVFTAVYRLNNVKLYFGNNR